MFLYPRSLCALKIGDRPVYWVSAGSAALASASCSAPPPAPPPLRPCSLAPAPKLLFVQCCSARCRAGIDMRSPQPATSSQLVLTRNLHITRSNRLFPSFYINCLENPMDRGAQQATVHRVARAGHNLVTKPPQLNIPDEKLDFPGGSGGKEPACQCMRHKRCGFDLWVRKIPWRRAWQSTPVFLPGESHGQRSLAGKGPWSRKEPDTSKVT